MKIIGVDLHTRQQSIAMLDDQTGELVEKELQHEGDQVREFYSGLPKPVLVGLEATGSMHWFLRLLEELVIEFRVGHPAKIRAAEPRKQKNDRRDARLLLTLLAENRFPAIWMPSREQRDLQILLRHRHQFVRIRTRVQLSLQALALSHGLRRGHSLWTLGGQHTLRDLPLAPHASEQRDALMALYPQAAGTYRRSGPPGREASATTASSTTADDASRRGADHGSGHRGVPRRSATLRRRQSGSQLHRDDSQRTHERPAPALRKAQQAG